VVSGGLESSDVLFNTSSPLLRFEVDRAYSSLVNYLAVNAHKVESFRNGVVSCGHTVVHFIDKRRHLQVEVEHAALSSRYAFFHVLVLRNQNAFAFVVLYLPAIGWVNLLYVDNIKVDVGTKFFIDGVEGRSLRPKGRSSIATKN